MVSLGTGCDRRYHTTVAVALDAGLCNRRTWSALMHIDRGWYILSDGQGKPDKCMTVRCTPSLSIFPWRSGDRSVRHSIAILSSLERRGDGTMLRTDLRPRWRERRQRSDIPFGVPASVAVQCAARRCPLSQRIVPCLTSRAPSQVCRGIDVQPVHCADVNPAVGVRFFRSLSA